jgi:hypothetical protein
MPSYTSFIVVLVIIDVRYRSLKVRKNMKRRLCVFYGWEKCFSCNKNLSCFDNNDCLFSKNIGLKIPTKSLKLHPFENKNESKGRLYNGRIWVCIRFYFGKLYYFINLPWDIPPSTFSKALYFHYQSFT